MTPPLTVEQLLRNARDLIANPTNWTTGAFARDKRGDPIRPNLKVAVCFCAHGAIKHANTADILKIELEAVQELNKTALQTVGRRPGTITMWMVNDQMGHAKVLEVYDATIARIAGRN